MKRRLICTTVSLLAVALLGVTGTATADTNPLHHPMYMPDRSHLNDSALQPPPVCCIPLYQVAAGAFPVLLVALGRSGRLRFPATAAAAVYMGIILATMWILQLFPAQARLAPIYTPVTHMVPPEFPLLLLVPGVAIFLAVMSLNLIGDALRDALDPRIKS